LSGPVVVASDVSPCAVAALLCLIAPSSPGLPTRTRTLTLLGDDCVLVAVDVPLDAPAPVDDDVPDAGAVQNPSGHCTTLWSIVASFDTDESGFVTPFVVAELPPTVAFASAVFDCEPACESPELPTRTDTFVLRGSCWFDCASALAPGPSAFAFELASFDCPIPWSSPGLFTRTDTFELFGECCPAFADALLDELSLPCAPAPAFAFAPFDCDTDPLSPGWSTRAETFELPGLLCDASAPDDACEALPFCAPLAFACGAGALLEFADGLFVAFVDGFALPFSLTGSGDDEGDDAGASPDDALGVSVKDDVGVSLDEDVVALGDASLVGAVGGSAAHAAVPHASRATATKTTKKARLPRRATGRRPSVRPLVPSTPHAGGLRSRRARNTCLLHLHFLESIRTPTPRLVLALHPPIAVSTSSSAAVRSSHPCPHESSPFTTFMHPQQRASTSRDGTRRRVAPSCDRDERKFRSTWGFFTRHTAAKGAFMTVVEFELPETEDARVARWRIDQLARAGYDREAASLLADARHVDLHDAVELMRRGCPVDTALRILL